MILSCKVAADFDQVCENCPKCNKEKENATWIDHKYKIGDYVLITKSIWQHTCCKLASLTKDPYEITAVHSNGNVSILLKNNIECIRQKPYTNDAIHSDDQHHGGGCAGHILTVFEIFENLFNFKPSLQLVNEPM